MKFPPCNLSPSVSSKPLFACSTHLDSAIILVVKIYFQQGKKCYLKLKVVVSQLIIRKQLMLLWMIPYWFITCWLSGYWFMYCLKQRQMFSYWASYLAICLMSFCFFYIELLFGCKVCCFHIPFSVKEAMLIPHWKDAMEEELKPRGNMDAH